MNPPITFTVTLDDPRQAEALAQFLKRVSHTTAERLSDPTREDEPYLMMDGLAAVRHGLAQAGYNPR